MCCVSVHTRSGRGLRGEDISSDRLSRAKDRRTCDVSLRRVRIMQLRTVESVVLAELVTKGSEACRTTLSIVVDITKHETTP